MDPLHVALLAGASVVAGAINSVAGGGSLVSFPAAVAAGLAPIAANATNCVAMTPGGIASAWAYRRELGPARRLTWVLAAPSLVGGIGGALLLLRTPEKVFDAIVPWLVLGATLIVASKDVFARLRRSPGRTGTAPLAAAIAWQFVVAVYGGYFGAGMGIVMLAMLALVSTLDMHEMNAAKSVLSVLINGVSAAYFLFAGVVDHRAAAIMTAGAVTGGFVGARVARRTPTRIVRGAVLVIGFGLTAALAWKRWG